MNQILVCVGSLVIPLKTNRQVLKTEAKGDSGTYYGTPWPYYDKTMVSYRFTESRAAPEDSQMTRAK